MSTTSIYLSQSCIKTLSAVEAERKRSNQHEFNGVSQLKKMFGLKKFTKNAFFSIRGTGVKCTKNITWYDARENNPDRTEYRLYFSGNIVMDKAQEGDNIIIGVDNKNDIHVILIKSNTEDHNGEILKWQ
ncbi:hypothetical protein GCM10022405_27170 [Gibbsiella dentisursi]|uniref:Type II restriction endonuclease n=1 Tax=Gibbsiella dentisursi TaxID=796890 RepID=A0ABP7LGV7_9GAMM